MKNNSELRNKVKDYIASIKDSDGVYSLFRNLNYPKETIFDSSYVKKIGEFYKNRILMLQFMGIKSNSHPSSSNFPYFSLILIFLLV